MDDHSQFKQECSEEITRQGNDQSLHQRSLEWIQHSGTHKYTHHFEWLGRPVIQLPQDIVGMQELLWTVQPDLIIETGIARGGSLILYSSILELIALCGGPKDSLIVGIDIDIRAHNKKAILDHPMSKRIQLFEGSSTAPETVAHVKKIASAKKKVMVLLDSNHTHEHVYDELKAYAPFVSQGSYCVVFDTLIEYMPSDTWVNRPWHKGNSPMSAVMKYVDELKALPGVASDGQALRLEIDKSIEHRLLLTSAPNGFLKRV